MEENQVIEQQEVTQEAPQPAREDNRERNFVLMRKKMEAEEAARIESDRRAADLERRLEEEMRKRGSQEQVYAAPDEDDAIDPEDYLQGKTFQKTTKKLKTKQSEQDKKIQEMQEKINYFEAKSELSSVKDFYEVVTNENVSTFKRLYPEDHQTVMSNPNLTAKSKTMYNMLKNYGIADTNLQKSEERIEKNRSKPASSSSASSQTPQTPLTRLGDYERRVLTESDRDRILAEVTRKKMSY